LLIFLFKVIVSALLIWLVLSQHSLADIKQAVGRPRWMLLLGALAVYGLSAVGGAWQWSWILGVAGLQTPRRELRRLYYIGLFFNNFLPANIGGDAYKVIDLGRQSRRPMKVFCATLLDRLIGLSSLTMLALVVATAAVTSGVVLPMSALALFGVIVVLFGGLTLLLSARISTRLLVVLRAVHLDGLADQVANIIAEFRRYRRRPGWFSAIFLFSCGVQFLRILTHVVVARALNIELDFTQIVQLFVLVPMLAISLTLPITVNGIGLRETVSAYLLTFALLTAPSVVAMELVAFLVQVTFSLYGGYYFLRGRRSTVAPESPPEESGTQAETRL